MITCVISVNLEVESSYSTLCFCSIPFIITSAEYVCIPLKRDVATHYFSIVLKQNSRISADSKLYMYV